MPPTGHSHDQSLGALRALSQPHRHLVTIHPCHFEVEQDIINEFILLLKASSLVSVVGIAELTRVSMNIASMTYRPLEAYVGGGLFYLAINLTLAGMGALAERRLGAGEAR